jgi:hypothetical protein
VGASPDRLPSAVVLLELPRFSSHHTTPTISTIRMIQKTKSITGPFSPDGRVAVPRPYVGVNGTV